MERRRFVLAALGGLLGAPVAVDAQPAAKVFRIGILGLNSAENSQFGLDAFRKGLRERGWVEGQNIVIEARYADGRVDRLPSLVAELIASRWTSS